MDNLKWWITLTPTQKVYVLIAIIVGGQYYFNNEMRKGDQLTIEQLTTKVNKLTITKDSALNVARIAEIDKLKYEAEVKEEAYQELKKRAERNEQTNEIQKSQLAANEAYANRLIKIMNAQKKISSAQ